jgi:ubiquinone/menaquinone biosynthesis C-methylase UbiE
MNDSRPTGDLETRSRVIHWALRYDLMLKLVTLGGERRLRNRFLDLARLAPGEIVLDAGCGPGTMAIAARGRVGDNGAVYGIDAAPEMIERARKKAASAAAEVSFQPALLESLPFPDAKFDLVMTSFVLHHLPSDLLPRCLSEIRRVLKPGGRLVAFDFAGSSHRHGLFRRHDHPHENFNLYAITPALNAAGLVVRERGPAGFSRAVFITATPGAPDEQRELGESASASGSHPGFAHLALVAALATWVVSMIAVGVFFAGRKWMWFSAGAAAAILGVHVVTYHVALGFGGGAMLGYASKLLRRQAR